MSAVWGRMACSNVGYEPTLEQAILPQTADIAAALRQLCAF